MERREGRGGIAFSAPSYTTRNRDFCFCIHHRRHMSKERDEMEWVKRTRTKIRRGTEEEGECH